MAKLGILTLHGMGDAKPNFDLPLRKELQDQWPSEISDNITFQAAHYHPAMQGTQEQTMERMRDQSKHLRWNESREFFLYAFSDATTYHLHPERQDSVYQEVHRIVQKNIKHLQGQLEANSPIVIIAQSLGGQVISNYLWDAQHNRGIWDNQTPDETGLIPQLQLLITTGCNIPLFVSGFKDIQPISKPRDDFQWLNFFDNDDVLGWPLEPLSPEYGELVSDRAINTGLTPLSHRNYWKDRDFVNPAAIRIRQLYEAMS